MQESDAPAQPVRVRFGPRPDQDMPLSWAEALLSAWREKHPAQFGRALADVAIGRERGAQS